MSIRVCTVNTVVACWLVALFSGCAMLPTSQQNTLPAFIPDVSALGCCWQRQEQLQITSGERNFHVQAVTAVQPASLTIVMLDTLGRRWMTVTQTGQQVEVDTHEQSETELPVQWLLLGVYLRFADPETWDQANSPYRFDSASEVERQLHLDQKTMVTTTALTPDTHVIDYPLLDMQVVVNAISVGAI